MKTLGTIVLGLLIAFAGVGPSFGQTQDAEKATTAKKSGKTKKSKKDKAADKGEQDAAKAKHKTKASH